MMSKDEANRDTMSGQIEPKSRHSILKRAGLIVLAVVTLISFAPVISLIFALGVADALKCQLDEGSEHLCLLGGLDIGGALFTGSVLGWIAFVTWPGMIVSLVLWIFLGIRRIVRRGRRPTPAL